MVCFLSIGQFFIVRRFGGGCVLGDELEFACTFSHFCGVDQEANNEK